MTVKQKPVVGPSQSLAVRLRDQLDGTEQRLPPGDAELESALCRIIDAAKKAWTQIAIDDETFITFLAERIPDDVDVLPTVLKFKAADLYLTCGYLSGDPQAQVAIAELFDNLVHPLLKKLRDERGIDTDDARQQLLERMLFPRNDRSPAIALYGGYGSLAKYLQVAAVHTALHMLRDNREIASSGQVERLRLESFEDDPELRLLKERYREEFKAAFQASVAALKPADRNLLRFHYIASLSTREIASISAVSHCTVARRLTRVRGTLLNDTRKRLMHTLGIGSRDFESIVALVQSQLDASIERVLAETSPPERDSVP